jgi:hypothetical protein
MPSCITTIDTIILTRHTNDAYLFDTYTSLSPVFGQFLSVYDMGDEAMGLHLTHRTKVIGVFSVFMLYNFVYNCDTCYIYIYITYTYTYTYTSTRS